MPGIVGLITKVPRVCAEPELQRMLGAIRHDSSYTGHVDRRIPRGVRRLGASRRLVLQRDAHAQRTGDVVLVFSGEEYSDPGAVANLRPRGTGWVRTGILRRTVAEADSSFPAVLNGRFQGLSIDRREGRATLFNDRSGMHRVYYHESKDAFYFAVEAKAILAVRPDLRRLESPRAGRVPFSCGCVLENRTLFAGIDVLPPASAWDFRNGSIEQKRDVLFIQRLGGAGRAGTGLLLRDTQGRFRREPPSVLQGRWTHRDVSDGGPRYADDHGLVEGATRFDSVLLVCRHLP